jgi:hypothetical protein
MKPAIFVGLCCLALAHSHVAAAGTAEEEARKNFVEGLALEATQPAEACKAFRKALEFTRELGPLTKVKECDVRDGRLLEAREKLTELTARLPPEDPELPALQAELVSIEARIARVEITLRPKVTAVVRVMLDGASVAVPSTVAVNPGSHELVVETEGRPVERTTLTLGDGEATQLLIPSEAALRPLPGPTLPPPEEGLTALGFVGIAVGSVGVAGLIGGAVTGGILLSDESEFTRCRDDGEPAGCDAEALAQSAESLLTVNGALFIAGGALAAIGATLVVVDLAMGPSDEPPPRAALRVGPSSASFQLAF